MVLGILALLGALAPGDISVPIKRPMLTRNDDRTVDQAPPIDRPSNAGDLCSAVDADEIVTALEGTTLRDFKLLERLGGASLGAGGGGFVGANAAVYRALCTGRSCQKMLPASASQFAIKVMFRPEAVVQEDMKQYTGTDSVDCTVAPGSETDAIAFASPAERLELALQGVAAKPARLGRHQALLPIYHCFVDAVNPPQLPDWQADVGAGTAHTGGGNAGQVPRGAKFTLFFVMPLSGPNLHRHATSIIHSRLAAAAAQRKRLDGLPETLTTHETQQIQALPVFSTIAWVGIAAQLAAGLAHMAEAGLAHRDVKLDNILLASASVEKSGVVDDDVPSVMLTDFGAALDAHAALRASSAGQGRYGSTPLHVPAESSLVRIVGGVKRRGGNPYNLPPEVLFAPIDIADGDDNPYIDYTGTDSWGLGTVMHELVAPTVEPWPGLRAAKSPFEFSFDPDKYQFLRGAFRPTQPDALMETTTPETGFALGVAVVAAGLIDKCLLLPITQPTRGDKSPIRLPIKEAREGFAALLLLLWWERYDNGVDGLTDDSEVPKPTKRPISHRGLPTVELGPPLVVVKKIVAAAQAELSDQTDASQCQSKGSASAGPWWVLREYLAREPPVVIHQRLSWLYEVYGAGLSGKWPHVAEGAAWPPRDGPWQLAHEKTRSNSEESLDGALGSATEL